MKQAIKNFLPTAEAISKLFYPHVEVLIHDIQLNQILVIYNPFSKRKAGDPSLLSEDERMANLDDCIGPYEKINWDGRKLKSVSSLIRDEKNQAVGMLCLNFDISQMEKINQFLLTFISSETLKPQPEPLFQDDWRERINKYIHLHLNEHHLSLELLTRKEKAELIHHLQQIGAFTAKNAALYIAQIIGVSRATIYNYLAMAEDKGYV